MSRPNEPNTTTATVSARGASLRRVQGALAVATDDGGCPTGGGVTANKLHAGCHASALASTRVKTCWRSPRWFIAPRGNVGEGERERVVCKHRRSCTAIANDARPNALDRASFKRFVSFESIDEFKHAQA